MPPPTAPDTPTPTVPSAATLRRLVARFRPHALHAAGVFTVLLLRTAMALAAWAIMGRAFDALAPAVGRGGDLPAGFVRLLWLLAGAFLLRNVFHFWAAVATADLGQTLENEFRSDLFRKVARLQFRYHDANRSGKTIARSLRDMAKARRFFREVAFGYLELAIIAVGVTTMSLVAHWWYGVAVAATIVVAAGLTIRVGREIARQDRDVSDRYDRVSTVLQENVAGARVVRAFGREAEESNKFGGQMHSFTGRWRGLARYWTAVMPGIGSVYYLAVPICLVLGVYRVADGVGSVGEVATVLFYVRILKSRMRMLTRLVIVGQEAVASAGRVFEVLDHDEDISAPTDPTPLPAGRGELRIEDVSFSHRNGTPVLRGLSLHVPAGSSLGILGPTGAGKSTLVQLLPRFYDPCEGRILLDGVDLRELDPAELRTEVGLVFQESFLFSATVAENIAYGRPDAPREDVEECARLAAAHDFVTALADGYETMIGERGVSLSGGQRQRLAIARALAMDPRVLIFDDATASVDAVTEKRLFEGIRAAARGRTSLVISQRVTSVRWCDRIAVLEDGSVSAIGTHAELLESSPLYREVAEHQSLERAAP